MGLRRGLFIRNSHGVLQFGPYIFGWCGSLDRVRWNWWEPNRPKPDSTTRRTTGSLSLSLSSLLCHIGFCFLFNPSMFLCWVIFFFFLMMFVYGALNLRDFCSQNLSLELLITMCLLECLSEWGLFNFWEFGLGCRLENQIMSFLLVDF